MTEQLKEHGNEAFNEASLEVEGDERSKQLAQERERSAAEKEQTSKEKEDTARHEVEKAVHEQEQASKEVAAKASPAERRRDTPTKAAREAVLKKQLKHVQDELSPASRAFSKVIHNKAVEKTSEALGSTIARPNAILYGSLFAFVFTAGIYFWAKHYNYPLSGFETIGSFIIGWLFGLIVDYIRLMVTGGRAS